MRPTGPAPYLPVLTACLILVPGSAHARQAKVDEQVVAPNEQGLRYSISPRGAHLVAVTQKGSRYVVLHDGVAGPLFDQIF